MTQFGVGELIALVTLTELGDVTRMSSSRKAVRFAGIDIGVHRSDQTSRVGKLTRQGSPTLRWALYEAAQSATRLQSPDYSDYHALKARGLTHTRASLTIARKIARRSYHLLHALGPSRDRTRGLTPAPSSPPLYRCRKLAASSRSFPGHPPSVATLTKTERLQSPRGTTDQPSRRGHHMPVTDDPDKAGRPRSRPTPETDGGLDTNHPYR